MTAVSIELVLAVILVAGLLTGFLLDIVDAVKHRNETTGHLQQD